MKITIASDLHIRDTKPACWDTLENFMKHQTSALAELSKVVGDGLLLVAGDVFHTAQPSLGCVSYAYDHLPKFITIPGQHDLVNHSLNGWFSNTGLGMLARMSGATVLGAGGADHSIVPDEVVVTGHAFGTGGNIVIPSKCKDLLHIHMIHAFTYHVETNVASARPSDEALHRHRAFAHICNILVTGDNHQPFMTKMTKQMCKYLINPGSLTVQASDRVRFGVYAYTVETPDNEADTLEVCSVRLNPSMEGFVRVDEAVLSDAPCHTDEAIEKLIAAAKQQKVLINTDFLNRLQSFVVKEQVRKEVAEVIKKVCKEFDV